MVHNHIDAVFEIKDGKFVQHYDYFSFQAWASQALGLAGSLLGGTKFLQRKVGSGAHASLNKFLEDEEKGEAGESAPSAAAESADSKQEEDENQNGSFSSTYVERYPVSADELWAIVGKWLALHWTGVIKKVTGDDKSKGDVPAKGAVRSIQFLDTPDDWFFDDVLHDFDEANRCYSYSSLKSPLPSLRSLCHN